MDRSFVLVFSLLLLYIEFVNWIVSEVISCICMKDPLPVLYKQQVIVTHGDYSKLHGIYRNEDIAG